MLKYIVLLRKSMPKETVNDSLRHKTKRKRESLPPESTVVGDKRENTEAEEKKSRIATAGIDGCRG